jgi:prepilin-type N-terminal cleavage/methylation domain-containing protein
MYKKAQDKDRFSGVKAVTHSQGFTLVELLAAAVISAIVLIMAGSGLINLLQANQTVETEVDQATQLNRAAAFIANDIREAKIVSTTAPAGWTVPPGYTGIIYLTKPDDSTVAYYTRAAAGGADWQGPLVIHRATITNTVGSPLVDQIAHTVPGCSGTGTAGFEVAPAPLSSSDREVTLCLSGEVANSTPYLVKQSVGLRSNDI